MQNSCHFQVGRYLVVPSHDKLVFDEQEIKLEPKIMQVLNCLIDHQGEVLSRQKIAESLWPEKVAGQEVVTRAIFELRKVFKDDSKAPKYIQTIPRKGYVFIHPIEKAQSVGRKITKGVERNFLFNLALVVSLIAITFFSIVFLSFDKPKIQSLRQTHFLTDYSQNARMHSVSPDWEKAILVSPSVLSNRSQLSLLDLKTQAIQQITNDDFNYHSPVWGQSNQNWYYIECGLTNCSIVQQNISTGEKSTLFDTANRLKNLAVAPDESQISFTLLENGQLKVATLKLSNPQAQIKLVLPLALHTDFSQYSHDSQSLFFITQTGDNAIRLSNYRFANQNTTSIDLELDTVWAIAVQDNNTLWISGRANGIHAIWSVNYNENILTKLLNVPAQEVPSRISLSSKSNQAIYESTLRSINLASLGRQKIINWTQVNSEHIDFNSVYSERNKTLYFISNRSGSYELWQHFQGTTSRLTHIKADRIERPVISVDGKRIAFLARHNNQFELTVFDLYQNMVIQQYSASNIDSLLSWSIDNQFLYYSTQVGHQFQTHRIDVSSGQSTSVIINSSKLAQESSDGNSLYYIDDIHHRLMVKRDNGEVKSLFKFLNYADLPSLNQSTIIGDKFYYIKKGDRQHELFSFDLVTKAQKRYFPISSEFFITGIHFSDTPFVVYDYRAREKTKLIQTNW